MAIASVRIRLLWIGGADVRFRGVSLTLLLLSGE
jgi:hypothetical protein